MMRTSENITKWTDDALKDMGLTVKDVLGQAPAAQPVMCGTTCTSSSVCCVAGLRGFSQDHSRTILTLFPLRNVIYRYDMEL